MSGFVGCRERGSACLSAMEVAWRPDRRLVVPCPVGSLVEGAAREAARCAGDDIRCR